MRQILLTLLGVALLAATAAYGQYQVVGTSTERIVGLQRTETTVQIGVDPLDRFQIIRLVKRNPDPLRGSLLLLPGIGITHEYFEQRDPNGRFGTSMAEYFAQRGYDVYLYGPRYNGVPAGACEAGVLDCSTMAGWDLQMMVDDVTFIRSEIERLHPDGWAVVAGHSLGAMIAVATVNAHPDDWDGAVFWEGTIATTDPEAMGLNQAYCGAFEAMLGAGMVLDGTSLGIFKQVAHAAGKYPDALTANPLFPPVLTNHQALVAAVSMPDPANPITMVVPTYVLVSGRLDEDRLLNASEPRVLEMIGNICDVYPTAVFRDVVCSIGGLDDRHVANLASFTGPVLALGAGSGYGPYMQDQLDLLGSEDVTFLFEPDLAHMEHFFVANHRQVLERPIWNWLRERWP